jgi:WD40 repeat protein
MKAVNLLAALLLILNIQSSAQQLSVQTGHSSTILDLEYSPDGKYLVSAGSDNKIIIWDLRSSKQMNILSGHSGPVSDICFYPEKKIIASASDDKTVKLWEYPSGKLLESYDFFTKEVKAIDFRKDGSEIACASDSIYIIDLKDKSYRTVDKEARRIFTTVHFSHLDRYLIFGGRKEKKIYLYSLQKRKIVKKFKHKSNQVITDKKDIHFYSAGNNGTIKREPISTISARKNLNLSAERNWHSFFSLAMNEDLLFGSNKSGLILAYNRKSGKRKFILKGHEGQVKALSMSPDGKFLASAGDDHRINIWDIKNKRVAKTLQGGTGSINSISFNEDGTKMFIAYNNEEFRIWDLAKKGDIIYGSCPELTFFQKKQRKNYFVSNSTKVLNDSLILIKSKLKKSDRRTDDFLSTDENLLIFDLKTSEDPVILESPKDTEYQSFIIADSKTLLVFKTISTRSQKYSLLNREKIREREQVFNTYVYIYDIKDYSKNATIKLKPSHKKKSFKIKGDVYYKEISADGKHLMVLMKTRKNNTICKIFDIEKLNEEQSIHFNNFYQSGGFNNKKDVVYMISNHKDSIYLYNRSDSTLIHSFNGSGPAIFNENDQFFIYADIDKNLHMFDIVNNTEKFSVFTKHLTTISSIKLNEKFNFIGTAGHDGIIKFWDLENGKNLISLAVFNESDYVYVNDDNYYYSTFGSMDFINFMLNERLYTFEQFDVKYNRPDLVLASLPYSTQAELIAYHRAYLKRLSKMGFQESDDESDFNIPEVTILNSELLPISSLDDNITVKIKADDSKYNLDRIHIWVNDVPVFGKKGISIAAENTNSFTGEFTLQLSPGDNKIQIACLNEKGYESLKETFYTEYDAKAENPDLYLVSIGVSEYDATEYNLQYAAKDAGDLSELFKSNKKYFKKIKTIEIKDKEATVPNIIEAKKTLRESDINDVVIVFFAGHGLLDFDMEYYLATTDINFYNPSENGLEYDMLEDLLNGIPARKKILFIDACHSGEVDKDEPVIEGNNVIVTDSIDERASDQKILNQSSFELMKHMFADIRKGTGSTIISSAGGGEYAYESEKTKNGIFTYILINGIRSGNADLNKDGDIMLSELRDFLMKNVSEMTQGYQNPTCRRQNLEFDFKVW